MNDRVGDPEVLGALVPDRSPLSAGTIIKIPTSAAGVRQLFKHPHLMHYNRLIIGVITLNLAVLIYGSTADGWRSSHSVLLKDTALGAQVNLAVAIIVRQQYVINGLCWLLTRPPTSWPLKVRWMLAKCCYHFGGLHVGSAVSGAIWYGIFFAAMPSAGTLRTNIVSLVLAGATLGLLAIMIVMAVPPVRARYHDHFEVTHRFCGWAVLMLSWAGTVAFGARQDPQAPLPRELLLSPAAWILLLTTTSASLTWGRLRKVPIAVERPSSHVTIVSMDHKGPTPIVGSARPISRHPLVGWHSFANIPASGPSSTGYRMVVSRAGDWTGRFIDAPPSHVWIRGIPTAGMANVRRLFKRVVYVATGSGIGPMLAHLLVNEVPGHLVWVTRSPRATYGDALVDEILRAQPDATIWNTDENGKPDIARLAYSAFVATGAEAVICIANKRVTWQVVYSLERLGIPTCGPIWDS